MKLYSNRFAPSPRRVRMYAAERGIALDIVEIDIAAKEHLAPAYLAINPRGEVPTLERDDGSYLTESLAICRWLEERQPGPGLFGGDAAQRAAINSCIDALMFHLYVPTTHVFRHTHPFWAGRLTQVPAFGEEARKAVLAEYARLDAALADREFLVAGRFTMADVVAYTSVDFGKPSKLRPDPAQRHLQRWYEAIGARASARA